MNQELVKFLMDMGYVLVINTKFGTYTLIDEHGGEVMMLLETFIVEDMKRLATGEWIPVESSVYDRPAYSRFIARLRDHFIPKATVPIQHKQPEIMLFNNSVADGNPSIFPTPKTMPFIQHP